MYRTEPVGFEAQGWFVNGVVWIHTKLDSSSLMQRLLSIERDMGRKRTIPNGPRVIDLDLLLYGQEVLRREGLCIPHPALHKRRFVLVPLCEISPEAIHPVFKKSFRQLLDGLDDPKEVVLISSWEVNPCGSAGPS